MEILNLTPAVINEYPHWVHYYPMLRSAHNFPAVEKEISKWIIDHVPVSDRVWITTSGVCIEYSNLYVVGFRSKNDTDITAFKMKWGV